MSNSERMIMRVILVSCGALSLALGVSGAGGCASSRSGEHAVKNPVRYFEIPVTDMDRAMRFYASVFGVDFERTPIDGNDMALFPFDAAASGITGALAKGESYKPGRQGVRIYFSVDDIDTTLARANAAGGRTLYPKTSIGELGWVAEFEDSEGNCIAIHADAD
jgi:predicted enzyme related to lactoylglutathione lyase